MLRPAPKFPGLFLALAAAVALVAQLLPAVAPSSWAAPAESRRIQRRDRAGRLTADTVPADAAGAGHAQRSRRLIERRARFSWHGRDPLGVKHVESRKQSREASTLKAQIERILNNCEIQYRAIGDDEIQRRIRIDDIIMSPTNRAAWVHVGVSGDRLETRQAIVWLVRNKSGLKTALARRYDQRGGIPQLFFVESKFAKWEKSLEKARKYPELNLPDPLARYRDKMEERRTNFRKWGVGDPDKPFHKWGYGKSDQL